MSTQSGRKSWQQPKLIVLARSESPENLTLGCKNAGKSGANTNATGCSDKFCRNACSTNTNVT